MWVEAKRSHWNQPLGHWDPTCSSRIQEGTVSRAVLLNSVRGSGAATWHRSVLTVCGMASEAPCGTMGHHGAPWHFSSCFFCLPSLCLLSSSHLPGISDGLGCRKSAQLVLSCRLKSLTWSTNPLAKGLKQRRIKISNCD